MRAEERTIKVSLYAGVIEIILALFMTLTGFHNWWYSQFHFFGVFGIASIIWAACYYYLYKKETGNNVWKQ